MIIKNLFLFFLLSSCGGTIYIERPPNEDGIKEGRYLVNLKLDKSISSCFLFTEISQQQIFYERDNKIITTIQGVKTTSTDGLHFYGIENLGLGCNVGVQVFITLNCLSPNRYNGTYEVEISSLCKNCNDYGHVEIEETKDELKENP